ncbi:hypothetical protein ACQ5SO_05240 [Rhodovulum sp. DZ06]|uniref:hypothetical protein n=1 Tax=Rhodovulum sp. DZ06 TaxID=3425126 RepID=UPI003D353068
MLIAFLDNLRLGFTNPRASARTLLGRGATVRDAVHMAVLALCIQWAAEKGVSWAFTGKAEATGGFALTVHMGLQMLQLLLMSVGAHEIGAKFGGRATREQIAVLSGWHLLLQAVLSPVQILAVHAALSQEATLLVLLLPLSVGLLVWIYASMLAEAHGFKRLGPVLLAVFLGFMALGMVAQLVLSLLVGVEAPAGAAA